MPTQQLKKCFFIAVIGEEGTPERERSDQVLKYIIAPAIEDSGCGYAPPDRADKITQPGNIITQVLERVVNDDLVVADLTGRNPNVYYELAVRHAYRKPIVQVIDSSEAIPFDLAPTRIIRFNYRDLDSVAECKRQLVEQIQAADKEAPVAHSPVSMATDLLAYRQSDNLAVKSNAEIITLLQEIRGMLSGPPPPAQVVSFNRPSFARSHPPRPSIAISPTSGPPGTTVVVAGSGFVANETGITVTYDSTAVVKCTAAADGTWTVTFTIPPSAPGGHIIWAYGPTTRPSVAIAAGFNVIGEQQFPFLERAIKKIQEEQEPRPEP